MLKACGASNAISKVVEINRCFHSKTREADKALANSMQKALVSLEDGEVWTSLKIWSRMTQIRQLYVYYDSTPLEQSWEQISKYLWQVI